MKNISTYIEDKICQMTIHTKVKSEVSSTQSSYKKTNKLKL